ncbi:class I SAM-dependent methyltransferase [Neoehrlichia mikurensis]|uniref:Ubiquinone/menaquinone biosynthesis C-methyltransferase UbiE n=1 Tax=Neoehrlichia mikurensis TaxID=89586 RepID=A0A9Q9BVH0_9RICK|nr:class I SAM-dependent methyltransferase [Neoehrlichia mikurensis]QXK91673.1 class I SAM-dependent methyltransferase [Neoehrlichia mikurensis]QXK92884.1 class I SAM-dependent methyltransferase [Neoehrlichia mikurensis]QXK93364.1 class I SAM-dependent methyltransferase [Neoehrlichia mikurensis]UTO55691.1 class I SAM-dependent methyltransferase [Neoehrlichia mikurensis]UTO56609.1 class I SAM-dependent methyltransferase [Neoehrlichia mikurensis]
MKKSDFVRQIFSSVAPHYNIMNDVMSFGLHRLWKAKVVDCITKDKGLLLDVAGGTGDIAIKILQKKNLDVTVCDISYEMITHGRNYAIDKNVLKLNWVCSNAEYLPFPNNTFDYYTIIFGIRNVSNRHRALQEAYRVLSPKGQFICLEFSPLQNNNLFSKIYDFYSFNIIPNIGKFIANNKTAYQYLVDSIRAFPSQNNFIQEIADSGFTTIYYEDICNKIATLYRASKI